MRILITGATGNVGLEVIRHHFAAGMDDHVMAGARDPETAKPKFAAFPGLELTLFDFERPDTFDAALEGIDLVFLLRPPHLADVERYFRPLIGSMSKRGVKGVVFLSVQGAEKSALIPHNKIETLIRDSGLEYIFLRPSYFMQNLTTTLLADIRNKKAIILPAGKAFFNWIDVKDIGEASAILLNRFEAFKNRTIEITGNENLDFGQVTAFLNQAVGGGIRYFSPNPIRYFMIKRRDGLEKGMILVMIMLHFLQRFQAPPKVSDSFEKLTGKKPGTLAQFLGRERALFLP